MPVQVQCPHCRVVCQIGEQFVGSMVNCGGCNNPFLVRGAAAPPTLALPSQPVPATAPAGQPGSAPAGTYEAAPAYQQPVGIKEGLRGVFKSLMPFSKLEPGKGPAIVAREDDVHLEFAPAAEAALKAPPAPAPAAPPAQPAPHLTHVTAVWSSPPPLPGGICRLDIGGATSPGVVRKRNEDSFLVQQAAWCNLDQRHEAALVVVADGLGGHEAGDRASHMVIQAIGSGLASLLTGALTGQMRDNSPGTLGPALETAMKAANQQVYRRSQAEPACRGMGATTSVVLIWDSQVIISHVGDTRVYAYRAGKATQLTRDQTLVEKMVKLGQLTPQQAAVHPARNEVAQALGRQPDVEPVTSHMKLIPGDWLFVACDGLHAHVDLPVLERATRESAPSATILAHKLVRLADERGGSDNCTVVAIRAY